MSDAGPHILLSDIPVEGIPPDEKPDPLAWPVAPGGPKGFYLVRKGRAYPCMADAPIAGERRLVVRVPGWPYKDRLTTAYHPTVIWPESTYTPPRAVTPDIPGEGVSIFENSDYFPSSPPSGFLLAPPLSRHYAGTAGYAFVYGHPWTGSIRWTWESYARFLYMAASDIIMRYTSADHTVTLDSNTRRVFTEPRFRYTLYEWTAAGVMSSRWQEDYVSPFALQASTLRFQVSVTVNPQTAPDSGVRYAAWTHDFPEHAFSMNDNGEIRRCDADFFYDRLAAQGNEYADIWIVARATNATVMSLQSLPGDCDIWVMDGETDDPETVVQKGRPYTDPLPIREGQKFSAWARHRTVRTGRRLVDPENLDAGFEGIPWDSPVYRIHVPPPDPVRKTFFFARSYQYRVPPTYPVPVRFVDPTPAPPEGWFVHPDGTGDGTAPDRPGPLYDVIESAVSAIYGGGSERRVHVAGGLYPFTVQPPSAPSPYFLNFYGGYNDDFTARDIHRHRSIIVLQSEGESAVLQLGGAMNGFYARVATTADRIHVFPSDSYTDCHVESFSLAGKTSRTVQVFFTQSAIRQKCTCGSITVDAPDAPEGGSIDLTVKAVCASSVKIRAGNAGSGQDDPGGYYDRAKGGGHITIGVSAQNAQKIDITTGNAGKGGDAAPHSDFTGPAGRYGASGGGISIRVENRTDAATVRIVTGNAGNSGITYTPKYDSGFASPGGRGGDIDLSLSMGYGGSVDLQTGDAGDVGEAMGERDPDSLGIGGSQSVTIHNPDLYLYKDAPDIHIATGRAGHCGSRGPDYAWIEGEAASYTGSITFLYSPYLSSFAHIPPVRLSLGAVGRHGRRTIAGCPGHPDAIMEYPPAQRGYPRPWYGGDLTVDMHPSVPEAYRPDVNRLKGGNGAPIPGCETPGNGPGGPGRYLGDSYENASSDAEKLP